MKFVKINLALAAMQFNEDLLQFIWKKRAFRSDALRTTDGKVITILHPGQHNHDSGPDFLNARIRINEIEWVGNVELHLKSSLWVEHKHHLDPAYDNVILHVVLEDDKLVMDRKGKSLRTLEVETHIDPKSLQRYGSLMATLDDIPCQHLIRSVEPIKVRQWLDRMLVQRLERKSAAVAKNVEECNGDLATIFFTTLATAYGAKVNAEPFFQMARRVSLKILMSHRKDRTQLEALLFGAAGMLTGNFKDDYPRALQKEFKFLQKKYALGPIDPVAWKWHRIRPSGFPCIRISQLAALLGSVEHSLTELLEFESLGLLMQRMRSSAHEYWQDHSRFDVSSAKVSTSMGTSAIQNLLINTLVPFQFYLGNERGRDELKESALSSLEELPAEDNRIVRRWSSIGIEARNSADSQALIELHNLECHHKKCLFCGIGSEIIGQRDNRSKSTQTI